MRSTVDQGWLAADIFHDINLPAHGPVYRGDICAQRPERWPEALAPGNLYPRLDAAVCPGHFPLRFQPCRSVTAAEVTLLARFDHQLTVLDADVVGTGGVVFKFIVAPAPRASVVPPFGRIRQAAVRLRELVGPNQRPSRVDLSKPGQPKRDLAK